MRRPTVLLAVLVAAGCLQPEEGPPPARTPTPPDAFEVESVATGLDTVWALAFSPDDRMFLTERPGRIRVVDAQGHLDPTPWATVDVEEQSESGLMGLALHPDFPQPPYVYVYHTYDAGSGGPDTNRLVRYTEVEGRGQDPQVLFDGIPGATRHDGGRIKFGPDGFLYLTAGDATSQTRAQDPDSKAGKIHRLDADGRPAPGNPQAGDSVYTLGHRNPQGLCWHPRTGQLYATEHGDTDNDEINVVLAGRNYGWPLAEGDDSTAGFEAAIVDWSPTIAPAGCTFYSSGTGGYAGWDGNLLFVTLKESDLRRIVLDAEDPTRVVGEEILLDGAYGRLRDAVQGPDGHVYLATSNLDGRGSPRDGDDRVVRLVFR